VIGSYPPEQGTPSAKPALRREGSDVVVTPPATPPDEIASAVALTLDGPTRLRPYVIQPDASGVLRFGAESCEIETRFEQRAKKENFLGHVFLTRWIRPDDIPTWTFAVPAAGRYRVEITYGAAGASKGTQFTIPAGAAQVSGTVDNTQGDWVFKSFPVGEIVLSAGEQTLHVKAAVRGGTPAMNLERVTLTPVR